MWSSILFPKVFSVFSLGEKITQMRILTIILARTSKTEVAVLRRCPIVK